MALARKGLRTITVNGQRYRWCVAPADEPGMGIVVEDYSRTGPRMAAWVEHGNIISPVLVRHAILCALEDGWNPKVRGADWVFSLENPVPQPDPAESLRPKQLRVQ